jgi:hypothetical protein
MRAVGRHMRERRSGRMVLTSSSDDTRYITGTALDVSAGKSAEWTA